MSEIWYLAGTLTSIGVKRVQFAECRPLLVPWTMRCWLVDVFSLGSRSRHCLSNRHEVHFVESPDRMDCANAVFFVHQTSADDTFAANTVQNRSIQNCLDSSTNHIPVSNCSTAHWPTAMFRTNYFFGVVDLYPIAHRVIVTGQQPIGHVPSINL